MFLKTSILVMMIAHLFSLTMATNSSLDPATTWTHYRNFLEKKGEFAPEEPMEIPEGEKYTIVTGGAEGADAFAERMALAYECKLVIVIGPRHPRAKCISPIQATYNDINHAIQALTQARRTLKRALNLGKNTYVEELMLRNYIIARDSYALYAFGYFENNSNKTIVQGGTGWTVQMALDMGKKVYLFDLADNQWYEFTFFHLEKGTYVKIFQFQPLRKNCSLTLNHKVGIIGSRNFTEAGQKEMRKLFQRTFLR